MAGQNLFLISFDSKEDIESVMERQSWLFKKQLIIFHRLLGSMERKLLHLVSTP